LRVHVSLVVTKMLGHFACEAIETHGSCVGEEGQLAADRASLPGEILDVVFGGFAVLSIEPDLHCLAGVHVHRDADGFTAGVESRCGVVEVSPDEVTTELGEGEGAYVSAASVLREDLAVGRIDYSAWWHVLYDIVNRELKTVGRLSILASPWVLLASRSGDRGLFGAERSTSLVIAMLSLGFPIFQFFHQAPLRRLVEVVLRVTAIKMGGTVNIAEDFVFEP
jgi:hypothetical protein